MVTYYMAPWQSLTQGNTPSDIESKICTTVDDGSLECVQYQAAWQVQVATSTSKMTSHVDLVTTVSGPGTVLIETFHANITTTLISLSLSTSILLE